MSSSWLEIDAAALKKNIAFFQRVIAPEKLCFVLKSNAYGHGLAEIYSILAPLKLPYLGVNTIEEALSLREFAFEGGVLVLASIPKTALSIATEKHIEHFLPNHESLAVWLASSKKPKIHLKFNTGLNRQGFACEEAASLARALLPHRSLVAGICSHFANVEDVSNNFYAQSQLEKLAEVSSLFKEQGYRFRAHCASSAAAMLIPESRLDLVRVGISLYGLWPSALCKLSYFALHPEKAEVLSPVLSWKAPILNIHSISTGDCVGYGCTFKASHPMELALVQVGYFEGFTRLAAEQKGSFILVQGQRCPVVGRISMNMLVADISGIEGVKIGDIATLLGRDGQDEVSAEDHARWAQTINYDFVARLNPALTRKMINFTRSP